MLLLALLAANATAYTDLNLDRCRVIARDAESGAMSWRCPGYGGVPLYVSEDDDRFDVDAGLDNGEWEALGGFNRLGPRVEWRLRRGRPIAIIYRYILTGADQPPGTRLAVKSIGRRGHAGCLVSMIDGAAPNANALARQRADTRAQAFRCGVDTPERGAD
jgi:hypothetical protein